MNLCQLKLLQVALFFTLLIIYHINVVTISTSIKSMNWKYQLLLKMPPLKIKYRGGHRQTSIQGFY